MQQHMSTTCMFVSILSEHLSPLADNFMSWETDSTEANLAK
jgi:hypothetical protein